MTTNPEISLSAPATEDHPIPCSVAIVEDTTKTRELLIELLSQSGEYQVTGCFESGEEAIKALPSLAPKIVLMDINLPQATGIECIRHLRPKMPKTLFIVLTTYDDGGNIFEALTGGAVGYLLKRSAGTELVPALREALGGGSPMSSSVARKVVQSFQKSRGASPEVEQLSTRERQVLEELARGQFYKEIADNLGIAQTTVHSYIRRIYEKLHVHSRMEAVAKLGNRL
jgi:DNA-binding NarL/FixJ family response regulator